MNEINSLTHSCIHSLASFAIFAFSGRAVFMILATGAKLRMLASDAPSPLPALPEARGVGEDCGEEEARDMIGLRATVAQGEKEKTGSVSMSRLFEWPTDLKR
jgi:hypothetical protein